jgi:hypothetical protein
MSGCTAVIKQVFNVARLCYNSRRPVVDLREHT